MSLLLGKLLLGMKLQVFFYLFIYFDYKKMQSGYLFDNKFSSGLLTWKEFLNDI